MNAVATNLNLTAHNLAPSATPICASEVVNDTKHCIELEQPVASPAKVSHAQTLQMESKRMCLCNCMSQTAPRPTGVVGMYANQLNLI